MKTSEQGIALIKKFEGFSPEPYRCPAGVMTIGYGHVVKKGDASHFTEEKAHDLLVADIAIFEAAIMRLVQVPLTQGQFDALASFTYNIGIQAFSHSKLVNLLNNNDYNGASHQFDRWVYANGKKLAGLVHRRQAEKTLFLSG